MKNKNLNLILLTAALAGLSSCNRPNTFDSLHPASGQVRPINTDTYERQSASSARNQNLPTNPSNAATTDPAKTILDEYAKQKMEELKKKEIKVKDKTKQATPKWKELCQKARIDTSLNSGDTDQDTISDPCEDFLHSKGYLALDKTIPNGWVMTATTIPYKAVGANAENWFGRIWSNVGLKKDNFNKALAKLIEETRSQDGTKSDIKVAKKLIELGAENNSSGSLFIRKDMSYSKRAASTAMTADIASIGFKPETSAIVRGANQGRDAFLFNSDANPSQFKLTDINGVGGNIETIGLDTNDKLVVAYVSYVYLPEDGGKNMYLATHQNGRLSSDVPDGFMVFNDTSLDIASIPGVLRHKQKGIRNGRTALLEPKSEVTTDGRCPARILTLLIVGNKIDSNLPNANLFFETEEKVVELPPQEISMIAPPSGCTYDEVEESTTKNVTPPPAPNSTKNSPKNQDPINEDDERMSPHNKLNQHDEI